ncbi:hypothetical protein TSUD_125270 [Trifolium subterraneum]|uniref:RNase H type-1 domain-containing protein n=1 Tax=Trifolium subterraneum TaxID=3900 RepID=A0A2Z6NCY8_TRISU|nr:hypothetical protein TSUD_125270 [Trifolium subterraneum]
MLLIQLLRGVVFRWNENAQVIFAATKRTDMRADPVLAEALALRWGINVVTDLRLNNVIFEIDAVNVVNCCKGFKFIASIDPFIVDCNELLSKLVNCSIKYVSRICNSAAHELAQTAKTMGSCTWFGNDQSLVVWSVFSVGLFA